VPLWLYDGWQPLVRTVAIGVVGYAVLVGLLRTSGKRTLSKMNAFDFVVTIAFGSALASMLLTRDVSLAQGCVALALLVALQFAITWSSVRVRWVRRVVTGEPLLVLHRGALLHPALRRARVTEDEVRAAVRAAGLLDLGGVEAVVLETDGSFTVVQAADGAVSSSSLVGVCGVVGRATARDSRDRCANSS
jgi:uncharacterized membrane protein YcaP (DUF421 family)